MEWRWILDKNPWLRSYRNDPRGRRLADRHYSRQTPGTPGFVPPGRCLVLVTEAADALWVTSWPFAEYVKHAWAGAWVCSIFRNESAAVASVLIRAAVAATVAHWDPPPLGLITFVDAAKVKGTCPGYCFRRAGFKRVGTTKGGLVALGLSRARMPEPWPHSGPTQGELWGEEVDHG